MAINIPCLIFRHWLRALLVVVINIIIFNNHQHHHHPVLIPPQLAQVPAVETITVTRKDFQQFCDSRLPALKSHLFYDILTPSLFAPRPPSAAVCTRFFMCFSWEKCIDMSERENIKIILLILHLCMDIGHV